MHNSMRRFSFCCSKIVFMVTAFCDIMEVIHMSINVILLVQVGLSLAVVGLLTLLGQFLWQKKILQGEYSRKFTHMTSAAWIASWRYFFDIKVVVAMAVILLLGVYITKHLKWFKSIYAVGRITYGELSYAVAIAMSALLFERPAVFALAIINLGFADGLAAIIGKKYGGKRYRVFAGYKTVAGTAACFLFALISGAVFWYAVDTVTGTSLAYMAIYTIGAGLAITLGELAGQKGLDNLAIPLITGLAYSGVIL